MGFERRSPGARAAAGAPETMVGAGASNDTVADATSQAGAFRQRLMDAAAALVVALRAPDDPRLSHRAVAELRRLLGLEERLQLLILAAAAAEPDDVGDILNAVAPALNDAAAAAEAFRWWPQSWQELAVGRAVPDWHPDRREALIRFLAVERRPS